MPLAFGRVTMTQRSCRAHSQYDCLLVAILLIVSLLPSLFLRLKALVNLPDLCRLPVGCIRVISSKSYWHDSLNDEGTSESILYIRVDQNDDAKPVPCPSSTHGERQVGPCSLQPFAFSGSVGGFRQQSLAS